ncbi:hypothetical protein [Oleiharenicola sp. Vm1]|uniref:hypothetical protein n=1 Tax=Oleiharenicola sp. Vm1 TaxID=3398393 RepID=UPI0039F5D655
MKSLAGSPKHAGRATRWCRCALVFLTSLPLVRAVDVSGDYEATGRIIASALEPPTGGVSLHGLLALEFDLALARQLLPTPRVSRSGKPPRASSSNAATPPAPPPGAASGSTASVTWSRTRR